MTDGTINLKALRKAVGLSQSQLARLLNVSQSTVSRYEEAPERIPFGKMCTVLHALGVPMPAAAAQSDEALLEEMRDYADRYDARWGAFDEGTDPDLYGLSRLVVTCSTWRWISGMLDMDGNRYVPGDRDHEPPEREYMRYLEDDIRCPDLRDPGTLGWILHIARETLLEPTLSVCAYPVGWVLRTNTSPMLVPLVFTSEAEALVWALKKGHTAEAAS